MSPIRLPPSSKRSFDEDLSNTVYFLRDYHEWLSHWDLSDLAGAYVRGRMETLSARWFLWDGLGALSLILFGWIDDRRTSRGLSVCGSGRACFSRPLKDLSVFNQVRIDPEVRTLVWPNGADFDPAMLHDWPTYAEEMAGSRKGVESQPRHDRRRSVGRHRGGTAHFLRAELEPVAVHRAVIDCELGDVYIVAGAGGDEKGVAGADADAVDLHGTHCPGQ